MTAWFFFKFSTYLGEGEILKTCHRLSQNFSKLFQQRLEIHANDSTILLNNNAVLAKNIWETKFVFSSDILFHATSPSYFVTISYHHSSSLHTLVTKSRFAAKLVSWAARIIRIYFEKFSFSGNWLVKYNPIFIDFIRLSVWGEQLYLISMLFIEETWSNWLKEIKKFDITTGRKCWKSCFLRNRNYFFLIVNWRP